MLETLQESPVIEYVKVVATSKTAVKQEITAALGQFEDFLRSRLSDQQQGRPTPSIPILVEHPVFRQITKTFPELNGDTPPVAILKTIANETGISLTGEVEVFRRIKKNSLRSRPTDVYVLHEEDALPSLEPEKPFRVDRQVKDGKIYSSIPELQREGADLGYSRLKTLLAGLPTADAISRNGLPILLYSEEEAIKAVSQWIEAAARKAALKESRPHRLDSAVWAATTYYMDVYNISGDTVRRILDDVGTTMFGKRRFYRRDQADEAFKQYYSRKPVEGMYMRNNEPRVTLSYLSRRTGIYSDTLRSKLESLASNDEQSSYILYSLVDSLEILNKIKTIPHVASDGVYTDEKNRQWASASTIATLLGFSLSKLAEYLEGQEVIAIRGNMGKPNAHNILAAYDVAQIRERASSYTNRPTLEEVKRNDSSLVITEDLAAEYGLPAFVINLLLSSIGTPIRHDNVKVAYPKKDARAELDAFIALPKMDRKKNQCVDAEGTIYVTKKEAFQRLPLSHEVINEAINNGSVRHIIARGDQVGKFELYSLADLQVYRSPVKARRPRSDKISPEQLEQEGREILASGGHLDSRLRKTHPGFNARVDRGYPGKLAGLRLTLGEENAVKKRTSYASMTEPERNDYLEVEGAKILQEGLSLSPSDLRANHSAFERAARKYYTRGSGGLNGLEEVLDKNEANP